MSTKINSSLDLYLLSAQIWGPSLPPPGSFRPKQRMDLWLESYPTLMDFAPFVVRSYLGLEIETPTEQIARSLLISLLYLEDIPKEWLRMVVKYYVPEVSLQNEALYDLDGYTTASMDMLLELQRTREKEKVYRLALSALRFEPLFRFRVPEAVFFPLEKTKAPYHRDDVRLLACSFLPKKDLGLGLGRLFMGELVARDNQCYFIVGNDNVKVNLSDDLNMFLSTQTLGRARARHKPSGFTLEWVELNSHLVDLAGIKLL